MQNFSIDKHEVSGILQQGTNFEGRISFVGTLKIGGTFKGEIISDGTLIIDESAKVDGTINVAEAIVKGHLCGELNATKVVSFIYPASFKGTVSTPNLKVDEGVHFEGSSSPPK